MNTKEQIELIKSQPKCFLDINKPNIIIQMMMVKDSTSMLSNALLDSLGVGQVGVFRRYFDNVKLKSFGTEANLILGRVDYVDYVPNLS